MKWINVQECAFTGKNDGRNHMAKMDLTLAFFVISLFLGKMEFAFSATLPQVNKHAPAGALVHSKKKCEGFIEYASSVNQWTELFYFSRNRPIQRKTFQYDQNQRLTESAVFDANGRKTKRNVYLNNDFRHLQKHVFIQSKETIVYYSYEHVVDNPKKIQTELQYIIEPKKGFSSQANKKIVYTYYQNGYKKDFHVIKPHLENKYHLQKSLVVWILPNGNIQHMLILDSSKFPVKYFEYSYLPGGKLNLIHVYALDISKPFDRKKTFVLNKNKIQSLYLFTFFYSKTKFKNALRQKGLEPNENNRFSENVSKKATQSDLTDIIKQQKQLINEQQKLIQKQQQLLLEKQNQITPITTKTKPIPKKQSIPKKTMQHDPTSINRKKIRYLKHKTKKSRMIR